MARASRVNSSITFSIFRVRPSAVVSNWKSIAHIAFGRIGHIAPTWVPIPVRRFFLRRCGHRRPSSRHSRRMRLLLTFQPALRAIFAARRHPHRGRRWRTCAARRAAGLLVGDRRRGRAAGWSGAADHRHARRSRPRTGRAASSRLLRLRFGVRSFPPRSPEHRPCPARPRRAASSAGVLALELLEPLRVGGLHPAVLGEPAMPRRLGDLEMPAHLVESCPPRGACCPRELADDLLRRVPPALVASRPHCGAR
jgi:hypothetical protein